MKIINIINFIEIYKNFITEHKKLIGLLIPKNERYGVLKLGFILVSLIYKFYIKIIFNLGL